MNLKKKFQIIPITDIVILEYEIAENNHKGKVMLLQYKTILDHATSEIIEKKSRFIANIFPIADETDATQYIEQIKKHHWDARHHCFAYVLGERFEIQRYSDDGEPSGTAGKPILDVLLGADLHDTLIIVTRYFGGTLLGTGGLVRAYSGAAKAGLDVSNIIIKKYGCELTIHTDYNGLGKIQYIIGQRSLPILDTQYSDAVHLSVFVPQEDYASFTNEMIDKTNGQAQFTSGESYYFTEPK